MLGDIMARGCRICVLLMIAVQLSYGQERRCDVPADVVFLMDASLSIKDTEWEQEKDFVAVLIDNLEVERYAIHVGVIVYSKDIGQVIDLQPFKTKSQLKSLLRQAVQLKQGTDTARAIAKLIEMSDSQGRIDADAKQIGVLITDGRSTNVSAAFYEARRARTEYNIDLIALGVGNETFPQELEEIVGPENPKRLFQVQNFAQLQSVVAQLQEIICEFVTVPTTPSTTSSTTSTTPIPTTSPFIPPFPCSKPADVVFLIDGSYSISGPDWIKGKQFVKYIINSIDIGFNSINVGLIVYGSGIGDVVPLQPFRGKEALKQAASGLIQPPVGKTNTSLGLRTVREMVSAQGRPGVPHITIVITDGLSSNPSETRDQAAIAKSEGITIFVVGVGNRVLRQEVEDMASSLQTLFEAPDFNSLIGMVERLRDNICISIQETTTPPTPTPTASPTPPAIPELCKECLVEGGVGFNPLPSDCEKYVMCLPVGLTYDPKIKTCPFGLFWSSEAVSCLDARYVQCPVDKCRGLSNAQTYPSSTSGCRSYFRCSSGRSTPLCCEKGYRYVDGYGCSADPACQDSCPLDITIYNLGACQYRPDPQSYYSYFEVAPGQGQVKRLCSPGQVYSHKLCACTYDVGQVIPNLVCSPVVNLTFEGSFEDQSPNHQPITVKHLALTNANTAYFGGDGHLTIPATANKEFGNQFVIKIKYRLKADSTQGQTWNNHWSWGFQEWYNNASRHGNNHTVITGSRPVTQPDLGRPKDAETKPLEVVTITKDGTVIRDPTYDVSANMTRPGKPSQTVDVIQLGNLGKLSTPTIINGVLYLRNGNNRLLVQETTEGVSGSVRQVWKVVTINPDGSTGRVEETGQGSVPLSVQQKYGFDLRSPELLRWYVLAPGAIVLQSGEGPIPDDVRNRYAGFTPGTLVILYERGGSVERWQISKPDGSQLQSGQGEVPQSLISIYQLQSLLTPEVVTSTWSVLAGDGTVLETGTGTTPANIIQKYTSNPTVTVLKSTSQDGQEPYWEVSRVSGVKVIEGRGSLPQGIAEFIQGQILLPQISVIRRWTVTLPDGTVRTGTGDIPKEITDLFQRARSSTTVVSQGGQVVKRWTVTLPDGTVRSGEGEIPADLAALVKSQGSDLQRRWEVTMPDGSVRSGVGEMPADILAMMKRQGGMGKRKRRAAHTSHRVHDLMSNCGSDRRVAPSLHLYATHHDVSLALVTSEAPTGLKVSLPVHEGLNDVMFTYDGVHLTGMVNGYVRKLPLRGQIVRKSAPVMLGQCLIRPQNHLMGEIALFEMYHCLP